ncbi:MAG: hypothetical protein ACJAR2_001590 [Ilumatobacter sp.]
MVIGSQSILASYPEVALPDELTVSIEADLLPLGGDDDADKIDGAIGEGSHFHETFGVYGQGVGVRTAVLPDGWKDRLVPLVDPSTGAVGWCLDPHDLCASKLIAGREKDLDFVEAAVVHRLIDARLVDERLVGVDDLRTGAARARAQRLESLGIPDKDRRQWRSQRDTALVQRRSKVAIGPKDVLRGLRTSTDCDDV